MKWKQVTTLIAVFAFSGHIFALEKKVLLPEKSPAKSINKVQPALLDKATFIEKINKQKSLNPDKPDFVGVPAVITDPNRP